MNEQTLFAMKGKTMLFAGAAAVAAALILVLSYQSSNWQERQALPHDTATGPTASFSNFTFVEFEETRFTPSQVSMIQENVCGEVVRSEWVPEKVHFAYLQPTATIYRMPCSIGPAGLYYHYFYESSTDGITLIGLDNPNKQDPSLFRIDSPLQAAEYIILFPIIGNGDVGLYHLAFTDSEYNQLLERCGNENGAVEDNTPVIKGMTISNSVDNKLYTIKINVLEDMGASMMYYEYSVTQEGLIERLDSLVVVGQCGYAI